ncbi:MAG: hypothetical protein DI565_08540 [Ancylobacter novellus]|uniref:DUF3658 domain-containing protein n=1 Tax=Ancylobacter novellus TaxID=921 RepID=A0A2W5KFN8_ANCNO|nr:MAG: hypothetical protein DI565_08540 [Ancylobacter novellus]
MDRPTRHVVFNPSARSSVLQALKALGRPDDVVALFDDLRRGPLRLSEIDRRERWFDEVLRIDFPQGLVGRWHREFWPAALDPSRRLVAWTSRLAAGDWTGYLAWTSRLGETPAEVIDISDIAFEWTDWQGRPARGRLPVPRVTPAMMMDRKLFDLARSVTAQDRMAASAELDRLASEDGAFRAMIDGTLTSLPLNAFDDRLMAATSSEFRKAARVIGSVLAEIGEAEGWCVDDLSLAARVGALVDEGRLEAAGDHNGSIRHYEVRRPSRWKDQS